ncbi:hypothetical protein [Salinisphaera sp. Q1T1-3]|uniref:hypothetical protein n=1 Tax=Salinisphaera sp. Q1T1-3 TaxID=2321229 RepID=UPI0011C48CB2|nr:hypothetical protein [Salinisphaera sp. Q1T1-3]
MSEKVSCRGMAVSLDRSVFRCRFDKAGMSRSARWFAPRSDAKSVRLSRQQQGMAGHATDRKHRIASMTIGLCFFNLSLCYRVSLSEKSHPPLGAGLARAVASGAVSRDDCPATTVYTGDRKRERNAMRVSKGV